MKKALGVSAGLVLGLGITCLAAEPAGPARATVKKVPELKGKAQWPILKRYDEQHLAKIALPLGGIGTGTVSLGGRGDLRDWEIMNRPAKGYVPTRGSFSPFFAVFVREADGRTQTRGLEGPIDLSLYEESHGSKAINHGLPRFRGCTFAAAYPLGQVMLSDADMPVDVTLQAFNPLVPGDSEVSGIPVAILRYVLRNKTNQVLEASVCGSLPNFIGNDGSGQTKDWKGDLVTTGGKDNRNEYRQGRAVRGIFMSSEGVAPRAAQCSIASATSATSTT